mmetsp:Transcript_66403/g.167380  ORF Transcript_66403/g.167380 Transcript_66403/m.167380 type:complete len:268 (+) Transcript_66403:475-1278(+)
MTIWVWRRQRQQRKPRRPPLRSLRRLSRRRPRWRRQRPRRACRGPRPARTTSWPTLCSPMPPRSHLGVEEMASLPPLGLSCRSSKMLLAPLAAVCWVKPRLRPPTSTIHLPLLRSQRLRPLHQSQPSSRRPPQRPRTRPRRQQPQPRRQLRSLPSTPSQQPCQTLIGLAAPVALLPPPLPLVHPRRFQACSSCWQRCRRRFRACSSSRRRCRRPRVPCSSSWTLQRQRLQLKRPSVRLSGSGRPNWCSSSSRPERRLRMQNRRTATL